jgi:D-aminopeptidase
LDAITDVPGVSVGHVTVFVDDAGPDGGAIVRTGVTAILPHAGNVFREKVPAAIHIINGFGKITGTTQVAELGVIETPIVLTNTLSVGTAFGALVEHALRHNPEIGVSTGTVNPLVAECNDAQLNDIRCRHVTEEHVLDAIGRAQGGPVAEGHVGAGAGMVCYGWKGGIGSASRLVRTVGGHYAVGALVLANFGNARDLTIHGRHIGLRLGPPSAGPAESMVGSGSCIVILATDAPADSRQLERLARRAQNGLARTGSYGANMSGEYVVAFTTQRKIIHHSTQMELPANVLSEQGSMIDEFFQAVVEATEEAVLNALFTADTVRGKDGNVRFGLPVDGVLQLLADESTQ